MIRSALLAALLLAAALLTSQQAPPTRPGPRPDGSFVLVNGWSIRPAGRQVPLGTFPMASLLSPGGKYLLVLQAGYMPPYVSVHDPATLQEISRVNVPDAWLGLTFAPNSSLLYAGGGSRSAVYEFALTPEGRLEPRRTFPIIPDAKRLHSDFIGDVALSPDGRLIYAAALHRDSIFVINPQSGMVTEEWKTGRRPYRILFHPDGKSFFVTSWADGTLCHHDASNGRLLQRLALGPAPMDMLWRAKKAGAENENDAGYQGRLFVTLSNSNRVAAVSVSAEKDLRLLESIDLSLAPRQPAGMTPSHLALSADQDRLYVTCSDANAVAVADVSAAHSAVSGFVPAGWYPTAARALDDGRLLIFNGRGGGSFANPRGPDPTKKAAPVHQGNIALQYVGGIQKGSVSVIEKFDDATLLEMSQVVRRNSPYSERVAERPMIPPNNPLAAPLQGKLAIEHVVYIVKENRTYDQVLGDIPIGNGDPSLVLFGENVSPNHHKLAREFVLLDNFYVNADVSADGHNWSSAAIAPAYTQRMWPNSYGARRRHYDYEGTEPANAPPAGYLWTNALARGVTLRNYGWWADILRPAPASGRQIEKVRDPALAPHTNMDYRGFDLDYKDVDRAQVFLKELEKFNTEGNLPRLITMRLGNDHTSGVAAGKIAPLAAMADNDAALGMIVEGLSRSRFWPKMAVFVLEDDAQNGPDHVDSHRSPCFVLSPYSRGRGVDSTFYNTTSVLRTMEIILGLRPMTSFDASANIMWNAFGSAPNLAPYAAEKPRRSLEERNPGATPLARRSEALDLTEADRADDDGLNDILWRAIRAGEPPPPVRTWFAR